MAWDPRYDMTLKNIQAQLEGQLAQRQSEIDAQQSFQEFTGGKISELLQGQGEARLGAISNYKTTLRQGFVDKMNQMTAMSTGSARDTISRMEADPARQAAMGTLQQAASGQGIARVDEHAASALGARGMGGMDLSRVSAGLNTSAQGIAAPLVYQEELKNVMRPFDLQAQEAQTMNTIAQTNAASVQAQAGSLAGLMQYEAGPTSVLSSLYGQSAGAYKPPAVSQGAIDARFDDYGYVNPAPRLF
ncbi:MAG: hypothetical protein DRJ03_04635 [Chloroflexi bacterium]|nr:MAG: hypothetical protein DRJ03_04635 [Chloroflexota bacterium]